MFLFCKKFTLEHNFWKIGRFDPSAVGCTFQKLFFNVNEFLAKSPDLGATNNIFHNVFMLFKLCSLLGFLICFILKLNLFHSWLNLSLFRTTTDHWEDPSATTGKNRRNDKTALSSWGKPRTPIWVDERRRVDQRRLGAIPQVCQGFAAN